MTGEEILALVGPSHTISEDRVEIRHDHKQKGNTLHQLVQRIEQLFADRYTHLQKRLKEQSEEIDRLKAWLKRDNENADTKIRRLEQQLRDESRGSVVTAMNDQIDRQEKEIEDLKRVVAERERLLTSKSEALDLVNEENKKLVTASLQDVQRIEELEADYKKLANLQHNDRIAELEKRLLDLRLQRDEATDRCNHYEGLLRVVRLKAVELSEIPLKEPPTSANRP